MLPEPQEEWAPEVFPELELLWEAFPEPEFLWEVFPDLALPEVSVPVRLPDYPAAVLPELFLRFRSLVQTRSYNSGGNDRSSISLEAVLYQKALSQHYNLKLPEVLCWYK